MNPHPTFAAWARAWLARLAGSGQSATAPRCDPVLLRRAIEQVVDGVDPRLRAVLDYARKLTPAVERTIVYFIECGQWLAAPVEFSVRRWVSDPLVRTLFATAAELQRFFSDDPGVRAYFHDHPLAEEVYIGLGVTRHERRGFGVAMTGWLADNFGLTTGLNSLIFLPLLGGLVCLALPMLHQPTSAPLPDVEAAERAT